MRLFCVELAARAGGHAAQIVPTLREIDVVDRGLQRGKIGRGKGEQLRFARPIGLRLARRKFF